MSQEMIKQQLEKVIENSKTIKELNMRKITTLNQKWYEQTLINKIPKSKLFQKVKIISENSVSIHQIINQNSGIKLKYLNDIELLKMVRKRKTILKYLEEEYFQDGNRKDVEYSQHKRRASNYLKWYQKLNKRKLNVKI